MIGAKSTWQVGHNHSLCSKACSNAAKQSSAGPEL
jgi:hypothetical protein